MSEAKKLSGSDARRAARNVSALIVASVISKGALFVWQLLLFAWLGAHDYGIYGTIGGLMVIAGSISSFGMSLIVIRDVAREPDKAGAYWSAMVFWQTALALVAYVGMNGFSAVYDETLRAFVALAGLNLFVDLFGNIGYDLLLAREKMLETSLVEIAHILLRIGLAVLALVLGWGLLGVYGAAIASGLLRSLVLAGLNLRDGLRPTFPVDRAISTPLLVNSAPLAASAFLTLAYQHTDKLMTTGILGPEGAGYLTVAFVINFGLIELFSTTVLVAAYPLLSRYHGEGKNPIFGFLIEKLTLYMVVIGLPMALFVSLLAPDATSSFFGHQNTVTAGILSILIWYTAITMIGNVFSKAMLIQNRQRLLLAFRALGLGLNIALNAILLTEWGDPRGAAIASVLSESLVLILLCSSFAAAGFQWRRIANSIVRLLLIAVPVALLTIGIRGFHFMPALLIGLIVYTLSLRFARVFNREDMDLLYRLVAALPGGSLVLRFWKRDVELSW
ncbi:MAG: flippase [Chloroflexota bacterium]|nr:flippase [Chloroflexota bacterium]